MDHSNRCGMNFNGADHQAVCLGLDAFGCDLGVHQLQVAGKNPDAPVHHRVANLQIMMWKKKMWVYYVY